MKIYSSIILLAFALILFSCSSQESVKVGFIGDLTGRMADLGIAGRDGALLAIEELNAQGGINGKPVELVTQDNKHENESCRKAVARLIKEKVVGVVGPMTSSMALEAVPILNSHKIVTISPTASTDLLANQDDYFFRIIPSQIKAAEVTARYAYQQKKYVKPFIIFEQGNSGYTGPWLEAFQKTYSTFPGTEVNSSGYTSKSGYDFRKTAELISKNDFDCLIFLASGFDTALFTQQFRKIGITVPFLACEWALTTELVEFGGKTVEGLELFHSFDPNRGKDGINQFDLGFRKRFDYEPGFANTYSYNAMKILLGALKQVVSPDEVKKILLEQSPYQGVQKKIRFNTYGDAIRDYTLLRVQNGKVITL